MTRELRTAAIDQKIIGLRLSIRDPRATIDPLTTRKRPNVYTTGVPRDVTERRFRFNVCA